MTDEVGVDNVSIVLVSLYRSAELHKTLSSIGDLPNIHVILNGARVRDYEWVIRAHPSVDFIRNRTNIGLSAAWNQGIVISDSQYVVLSSDDLDYPPDWLDALLSVLNAGETPLMVGLSDPPAMTAFCVDKRLIALQGWFDHNFTRVYYEDEDWFARCQERLGRYGTPTAWEDIMPRLKTVRRLEHRSAPWNSVPNRLWFWRKWQRLPAPGPESLVLPNGPEFVKRRLDEPSWPHLDPLKEVYAAGDFGARPFKYDPPGWSIRLFTVATTNPLFVKLRRLRRWRSHSGTA